MFFSGINERMVIINKIFFMFMFLLLSAAVYFDMKQKEKITKYLLYSWIGVVLLIVLINMICHLV